MKGAKNAGECIMNYEAFEDKTYAPDWRVEATDEEVRRYLRYALLWPGCSGAGRRVCGVEKRSIHTACPLRWLGE